MYISNFLRNKKNIFILVSFFFCFTHFPINAATLKVENGFESSSLDGFRCSGNCLTIATSPTKEGSYSGDFVLTRNMPTSYRTEVVLTDRKGHFDFGKEYWVEFDYQYEDWVKDKSAEAAPMQIHTTPSDWANCTVRSPSGSTSARATAPVIMASKNNEVEIVTFGGKVRWKGPIEMQQWLNIKFHFKVSTGSDGFIEAWKDGAKLFRVDGPNSPQLDDCGKPLRAPYFKMGVYKWDWKEGRPTTESSRRQLFIDNLKIAEGSDPSSSSTPPPSTNIPTPQTNTVPDSVNDTEAGLVTHWSMETATGANIPDSSNNGRTGTLVNGAQLISGEGIKFDGFDDHLDVGKIDFAGNEISVSAGFLADDLSNCSYRDCRIISKAKGTAEQDHNMMVSTVKVGTTTRLRFRLKTNGVTSTLVADSGDLYENEWVHVAAVYDGQTMRLYKDGVEVGRLAKQGSITADSDSSVWIGDNPQNAGSRPWKGHIDDVRVYNLALSASEISNLSNSVLTPIETVPQPIPATESEVQTQPETQTQSELPLSSGEPLIFEDGFENGDAAWRRVPAVASLTNVSREGQKAMHFFSNPNGKRSEFVINGGLGSFAWGNEYWVGFSLNMPEQPRGYRIISQHHSVPHVNPATGKADWSCTAGPNSFTIRAEDGNFDIRTSTIKVNVDKTPPKGAATWGTASVKKPFQLNTWHDFVLHFRYVPDNTGFMEVWLDGEKIVNTHNNPTVYNNDLCGKPRSRQQYQKIGFYHGTIEPVGQVIYDAFRIGGANSSYTEVAPR
ncbi:MAG: heparin lyase I family protein [Methylococcaceae bacterium]